MSTSSDLETSGARVDTGRAASVEHDSAAAAVVAEAVAIALEAEATQTAAAVVKIADAVATAAATAARAADRARDARTFAAEKAAETIAREAAQTALHVQLRADAAAVQVAQAAALAVEDLLAFGSQLGPSKVAILLAKTVLAAAEATAEQAARAADVVATAVADAAAQMAEVTAASDDADEVEVSAAADALAGLTTATASRVALGTQAHAAGAALAAREAAAALEVTATQTRTAQRGQPAAPPTETPAETPVEDARPLSPSGPRQARERGNDYASFNGTLHKLSGLALGDGSRGLSGLLASVADFAAAAVPGVNGVGLTWSEPDRPDVMVATSDRLLEVTEIDMNRRQGPGSSAAAQGRTLRSGSLDPDTSWPDFGLDAAELGVYGVLAVPLIVEHEVLGSLHFYRDVLDGFDDRAVDLAEAFAETAARFLQEAQVLFESRRLVGDLRTALKTRAVIDQAIGIMMSRSGYSPQEAFNGLRSASQSTNLKVHLVAERLVRNAVRRALARQ